jgi:hypothetical protein
MYVGGSNENLKSATKNRNTVRFSCKLATVLLMVWRVATGGGAMVERNTTAQQHCKMAVPLLTFTRGEQRSVIRFLSSEGVKPTEIHRRMEVQYDDACLSLQQVYKW